MNKRRILPVAALTVAALTSAVASGEEALPQPYELVRSLRVMQDGIAAGDTASYLAYHAALAKHAALLARAPDEAWQDRRNVRAAIAFVLSGGDPRLLQKLVRLGLGPEDPLARAALAYGENRNAEAMELLADVDPRALDSSIAGHIALVRSELLSKKDPDKALALLAEARLLAPGTMIEEAALRRESSLAADRGDADRFETVMSQYLRRFGRSVHMANFRRQFATSLVTRSMADDGQRRSRMQKIISTLEPRQQEEMYLSVAWEGIMGGNVEAVRWAAANAAQLGNEGSASHTRARLFEASVLVLTDQYDQGLSALKAFAADKLDAEEEGLLAAALSVAAEIRRTPQPLHSIGEMPPGANVPRAAAVAKDAIARVDHLMRGAHR
jgi:chemotaxis protein MotC